MGRKIFEVIAPELAEAYEGKVLEDQEAEAARRTSLTMREDDAGTCHGRFRIPALHGQMLRKMIQSLTAPTRDPGERLPAPVEHGQAFCDLIERISADKLPKAGGCSATVVVTMTLEQLLTALGAAGLDTGGQISATEARRLACTAGIIPVVLGGAGQVLDVGQTPPVPHRRPTGRDDHPRPRLHRGGLRPATGDVPRPPRQPWSAGGPTDLDNGRLLCGHHHRRIHDPTYETTHHPRQPRTPRRTGQLPPTNLDRPGHRRHRRTRGSSRRRAAFETALTRLLNQRAASAVRC